MKLSKTEWESSNQSFFPSTIVLERGVQTLFLPRIVSVKLKRWYWKIGELQHHHKNPSMDTFQVKNCSSIFYHTFFGY